MTGLGWIRRRNTPVFVDKIQLLMLYFKGLSFLLAIG
jgi:hypothetical protein